MLVAALLVGRRRRGIVAPAHAPIQRPPPPQAGGDDGTWRAARGAQGPVGENGGGGVGGRLRELDEGEGVKHKKREKRMWG